MKTTYQEAADNTAMKSPDHLKNWLKETGRSYLVLRTDDLVDALPWPGGVEALIQVIESYRQHRRGIVVETDTCPRTANPIAHNRGCNLCSNTGQVATRCKDDRLEPDEIDAAIELLRGLK